jgi:hypothetical protein
VTWNQVEKQVVSNSSSNSTNFALRGGNYGVAVHAGAYGGGNIALQRLGDDGSTWLNVLAAFTADGIGNVSLPAGTYRFGVTTATGVYASVTGITTTQ